MFISIQDVSMQYRSRRGPIMALQNVSLDIARGEFVSVIGPSGCGKSTLMMIVSGLVTQSGGAVFIGGDKVSGPYTKLGIVFQQDALLDWRTVMGNVMLQADIRGLQRAPMQERARELLALVGLDGFGHALPHELSGGMRQRISICRALLHEPELLLMDEPFGALDALTRDQLNIDLLRVCAKTGVTTLFVTHSMSEAVLLSDKVVVMSPRPGRIEGIVNIALDRPRRLAMRRDPAFVAYHEEVTAIFRSTGVLRDDP